MTTPPTTVQVVTPSKAKAWWALLIPQAGAIITLILTALGGLPAPYGPIFAGILSIVGVFTGAVVHQAPYLQTGTMVVPTQPAVAPSTGSVNPYRQ